MIVTEYRALGSHINIGTKFVVVIADSLLSFGLVYVENLKNNQSRVNN